MLILKIPVLLLTFTYLIGVAQAQEWGGIMVMKSTCADVEKLLGVFACAGGESKIESKREVIKIRYAQTVCEKINESNRKVEIGTVISIHRQLKLPRSISEFKIKWQYVETFSAENDSGEEFYYDKKDGITYLVINGYVHTIYYGYPAFTGKSC